MKMVNKYKFTTLSASLLLAFGLAGGVQAGDISKLVKECADCHGKNGNTELNDAPSIAGMSVQYFKDAMAAYKSGARPVLKLKDKKEDMNDIVKKLSDEDITALADHYSKEKFVAFKQSADPALAKEGKKLHKKYCDKCHSAGGTSAEDDAGILAGQPLGYLKYSMDGFDSGKREMGKKMSKKFKNMKEKAGADGITQLIHYYASQQ